jgi:hypothetical protein
MDRASSHLSTIASVLTHAEIVIPREAVIVAFAGRR